MSWSEFVWDPNLAGLTRVTLTTTSLAFDHESMPKQSNLTCETGIYCPSGNCCIPQAADLCDPAAPQLFVFADGMKGISTQRHVAACLCNQYPCDGFSYTCGITNFAQVCGVLNDQKTCSLGNAGTAKATGTTQGTDWAITINGDYLDPGGNWSLVGQQHTGWVHGVYSYDFSNYNINQAPNGPYPLSQWLSSICTQTSAAAPKGMDPVAGTRIRDSHILYGIVLDFYNQLYNDGYYSQHPNTRLTFQSSRYLSFGFKTYTTSNIFNLAGYLTHLYPTGLLPDPFLNALTAILQPPLAIQLPNSVYKVSLQLSYPQFVKFQAASDKDSFINAFLAGMLCDQQGQMGDLTAGQQWSPDNPVLAGVQVDSITAIELWDSSSQPNYLVTTGIAVDDWQKNWGTKYPNYIFATAQVTGAITKWSPMLAIYFQVFANASFDAETCWKIANPPRSAHSGALPVSCYNADCLDQKVCITDIQKYCPITYVPPPFETRTTTDNYLVSNNFADCYCYTSALAPISNPSPGNIGAMCFDKFCSPQFRQEFDLNDAKCKTTCEEVYKWMTGTGADQSQNASHMDWQRFEQICGKQFRPYTPATLNTGILVSGITATLLIGVMVFALAQHKSWPAARTWSRILMVSVFLMAVTGFLARDFAGLSNCNDTKPPSFQCTSRITKRPIPKQFCNYVLNCECLRDEDCPNGCLCASTSCQPQSGTRGFTTVQLQNRPMLIISGVLAGLFALALFLLYREEHWKINKFVFMAGVLGVAAIPLLYYWKHTTAEQVFSEPCQKGGVCEKDSDCQPGTRCVAGQCEALATGCPVANPAEPPAAILPTGSYIIQAKPYNQYLYPAIEAPVTIGNGQPAAIWVWNAEQKTLTSKMSQTGLNATLIAYDVCAAQGCSGTIYGQDISRVTPAPKFVLGENGTIYSVEARTYIVPDSNPCQKTPCPAGNCGYLTYSGSNADPQAWVFTACDPAKSCATSCGTCLPFTACDSSSQQCLPAKYSFYFFKDAGFQDPAPQQLNRYGPGNCVWAPASPPQPTTDTWFFDPVTGKIGVPKAAELTYNTISGVVIAVSPGQSLTRWRMGPDNLIYLDTPDNWFIGQDPADPTNVRLSMSATVAPRYLKAVPTQ